MTKALFGTDGIRGVANQAPMDSETVLALARTLAQKLLPTRPARVIIGKDTRASGYMLETALASGLISEGVDIHWPDSHTSHSVFGAETSSRLGDYAHRFTQSLAR